MIGRMRARGATRAAGVRAAALAVASILAACGGAERPGTPPRHVLLVTVDTLRADHLSIFGYPRLTTWIQKRPDQVARGEDLSIDDLAKRGVTFTSCFAPRGQTTPSIATLMTGRPPLEHGVLVNGQILDQGATTLAEMFQARGFRTAGFTSNALLVRGSGIEQGFEHFVHAGQGMPMSQAERDLEMVRAAVTWMGQVDYESESAFVWLHFMGPHMPYDPEPLGETNFARTFSDPGYEGEADGSREFLDGAYEAGRPLGPLDIEHVRALYDGEIARVNALFERFLASYSGVFDGPERVNRLDDTVLVFASDHGEELYQRNGYWAHSKSVYDSVLHVPLFLTHPNSLTGERLLGETVELQDVLPTLAEWFDLEVPDGVRGRSLLALTDSYVEKPWDARPAFGSWRDQIFTARTPEWRFVWNGRGVVPNDPPAGVYEIPRVALYDERADPQERRNVIAEHPEVADALARELQAWLDGIEVGRRFGAPHGEVQLTADQLQALRDQGYGEPPEDDWEQALPTVHDGRGIVVD